MRFQLGRIRFSISFWFFALIACVALLDREILLPYFALPILVHECGHITVLLLRRVPLREVRISALGIAMERDPSVILSDPVEIAVCLGGIAANLLWAAGLYVFCFQSVRIMFLIASNVAVALFNALPIGDLDGGQIVRLLTERFFSPDTARLVSLSCSLLVLAVLFGFALFLLLARWNNPTLLVTCLYLAFHVIKRI